MLVEVKASKSCVVFGGHSVQLTINKLSSFLEKITR